jgi:anti-sigma-K factor RskA
MSEIESGTRQLHAYHDGELRGLARWRFERRLRREAGLRRELEALERMGDLVRASAAGAPGPDLWDRIEQRLPAIDAQRAERGAGRSGAWLEAWWRPLGAVAVASAALFAVWLGFGIGEAPAPSGGTVRWMDSGGRSVLVLDEPEADVTIIWLLEDAVEGAARGGSGDVV